MRPRVKLRFGLFSNDRNSLTKAPKWWVEWRRTQLTRDILGSRVIFPSHTFSGAVFRFCREILNFFVFFCFLGDKLCGVRQIIWRNQVHDPNMQVFRCTQFSKIWIKFLLIEEADRNSSCWASSSRVQTRAHNSFFYGAWRKFACWSCVANFGWRQVNYLSESNIAQETTATGNTAKK